MVEPPMPPTVGPDDEQEAQRHEETATAPGDPVPAEEPADRRGEDSPDRDGPP